MQKKQNKRHIVDILFVLALFAVFAFCALALVILGANIYKNTVSSMSRNFESRTACSYITEKIRQNDLYDSVYVADFEGQDALLFTKDVYGSLYGTYIYYYDGELKELFIRIGSDIGENPLSAGTTVMQLDAFQPMYVSPKLISVTLTTIDGDVKTIYISPRSHTKEVLP